MEGRRRNRAAKEQSIGHLEATAYPATSHIIASRQDDFGSWSCSVCTFENIREAFKCNMCDTRKGTSTRKPRLNNLVVEQQQLIEKTIIHQQLPDEHQPSSSSAIHPFNGIISGKKVKSSSKRSSSSMTITDDDSQFLLPPKLSGVDRSHPRLVEVTFEGVTITIREFRLLGQKVEHSTPEYVEDNDKTFVCEPTRQGLRLNRKNSRTDVGISREDVVTSIGSAGSTNGSDITLPMRYST